MTTTTRFRGLQKTAPSSSSKSLTKHHKSSSHEPMRRSMRLVSAAATLVASSPALGRATTSSFVVAPATPRRTIIAKKSRVVTPFSAGLPKRGPAAKSKLQPRSGAAKKRTESFGALWHGSPLLLDATNNKYDRAITEPHTLILGTHPSITSLKQHQYFAHEMNAFWWIAGDCLGFRRGAAISPSSNKPYAFAAFLRHDNIFSYTEQLEHFTSHGFCLWDIVQSCHRPGSLDQDIKGEVPNDIRAFVKAHPTIRRIVLANGGTGCKFFVKHYKDWLESGELCPLKHEASMNAFGKVCNTATGGAVDGRRIELVSALAVSPAAARWTYEEKRDFWDQYVYSPGLKAFEQGTSVKRRLF